MSDNEIVFSEALSVSLDTYAEMRRRSMSEVKAAAAELQRYLPKLIAEGELDRERLVVKGLTHLRKLEHRPRMSNYRRPAKQQASAEPLTS